MSPRPVLLSLFAVLPILGADLKPVQGNELSALDRTGLDRARSITSLGYEYESTVIDESGTDASRNLLRGTYAQGLLGVAIDVPISCRYNPGSGNTVNNGFGDLLLSGTIANAVNDKLRVAGGVDLSLDTASRDELGHQATQLTPLVAVAYAIDPGTRITGSIRYTADVTRQSEVQETREMEFRLGAMKMTNDQVFGMAEMRQGNDFVDHHFLFAIYAAAGVEIVPHHVARLGFTQPLDHYSRDTEGWQTTLDYAYVF